MFKKGYTPWNKGKKGYTNAGSFGNGKPSWNKGLTGYHAGENHHWIGRNMSGENSPVWVSDRTKLARYLNGNEYRNSATHREWSLGVKNRDGWKCKIANGDCSGRMEAHHILGWKSHPNLRYTLTNGITLCHFHHPRTRAKEAELSPYFQELVMKGK